MSSAISMMATTQAAQIAAQNALVMQTSTLRFFRSKNATTENNAVEVSDLDWLEMGMSLIPRIGVPRSAMKRLFKMYGITKTNTGKYWLNTESFLLNVRVAQEKSNQIQRVIIIIAIIMMFAALLFPLIIIYS